MLHPSPSIKKILLPAPALLEGSEMPLVLRHHVLLVSFMAFAKLPAEAADIERTLPGGIAPVAGRTAMSGMA
jgi:hypothetical protein